MESMNIGMTQEAAIEAAKKTAKKEQTVIAVVCCPQAFEYGGDYGYAPLKGAELLFFYGSVITAVMPNGQLTDKFNGQLKPSF